MNAKRYSLMERLFDGAEINRYLAEQEQELQVRSRHESPAPARRSQAIAPRLAATGRTGSNFKPY
ncbi:MAG: hypothetical protein IPN53_17640 [Comamonadaceae bacterium]|nr:hypothetical protein [Comamonadaceae bacterium]